MITRLIYAYFIGLSIGPSVVTVVESTPMKYRGVVNIFFVALPFCFGELIAALVALFTIDDN